MSATRPVRSAQSGLIGRLRAAATSTNALAAQSVVNNGLRFGSNLVLTRLLVPEAFGIILVVTSITYILAMLAETGISAFLIRTPAALERRYYDTLWTVQVARGLLLAAALFAVGPFITDMMGKPEIGPVLRVCALLFVFDGLRSLAPVRERRLRRDYVNSGIEMIVAVLRTGITIGLAFWLQTYWALVIGMLIAAALTTISTYVAYTTPWHQLRFDRAVIGELWRFSRFIAASSFLTILIMQFDKVLIITEMSLETAGLYNMAVMMTAVAATFITAHTARVHLPEVAHAFADGANGAQMHYKSQRLIKPLIVFACAGGVTFGQTFFEILFDPRYEEAGVFFSILVIGPIIAMFARPGAATLVAMNRPKTTFYSDLMRIAWLPVGVLGGHAMFGLKGLLYGVASVDLVPAIYFTVLLVQADLFDFRRELPSLMAIPAGLVVGVLASLGYDRVVALV